MGYECDQNTEKERKEYVVKLLMLWQWNSESEFYLFVIAENLMKHNHSDT